MIIDLGVWKVTLTVDLRDRLSIWVRAADDSEVLLTSADPIARRQAGDGSLQVPLLKRRTIRILLQRRTSDE